MARPTTSSQHHTPARAEGAAEIGTDGPADEVARGVGQLSGEAPCVRLPSPAVPRRRRSRSNPARRPANTGRSSGRAESHSSSEQQRRPPGAGRWPPPSRAAARAWPDARSTQNRGRRRGARSSTCLASGTADLGNPRENDHERAHQDLGGPDLPDGSEVHDDTDGEEPAWRAPPMLTFSTRYRVPSDRWSTSHGRTIADLRPDAHLQIERSRPRRSR